MYIYFNTVVLSEEEQMIKRYGLGKTWREICPTCNLESDDIYSKGVHTSANGMLQVYSDDDKFVCGNCKLYCAC
jgi:hypothetical protein